MVDPIIIGVGSAALAMSAAAIYAYTSGTEASASVDIDNDGEDDASVTFVGKNTTDTGKTATYPPESPVPAVVGEKDGLEDVKGIGPTRAAALAEAGYERPEDLYYTTDDNLTAVSGIGGLTVSQIREDIGSVDDMP